MKKEFMNKLTGEVIDGEDLMGFIDEDKLSKNTEYYGYYQLVSSELEMSEEDIIEKYHGLNQIENQFKIMKKAHTKLDRCMLGLVSILKPTLLFA